MSGKSEPIAPVVVRPAGGKSDWNGSVVGDVVQISGVSDAPVIRTELGSVSFRPLPVGPVRVGPAR